MLAVLLLAIYSACLSMLMSLEDYSSHQDVRICPYPNLNLVRTTLSLVDFGTSGISVLVR